MSRLRSEPFKKREYSNILFIIVPLLLVGVLIVYPFSRSIYYSFTSFNGFSVPTLIGFDNYKTMFSNEYFYASLRNNFVLAAVSPFFIFIPLFLAIIIFKNQGVLIRTARMVMLLPYAISMTIAGVVFRAFLQFDGPVNSILNSLGLHSLALEWLSNSHTAFPIVILAVFWRDFGIYSVIYLAALSTINRDLLDAARVDGVSWLQEFRYIIVPTINPIIVFVAALVLITDFKNMFDYVYNITRGGPGYSTHTIEFLLYREGFHFLNMGYASGLGVIIFLVIFLVTFLQIRIMTKD
jgi:ABC-type sugar transport system permease subunit